MAFLGNEIILPLFRRAGTAFGAYLVGLGVAEDQATLIAAGVTATLGVALDLIVSHYNRKGK